MSKKTHWTLATTATVGVLTALAMVGTLVIRIPIPATTGYFNIGDVFVILSGLWLGPLPGFVVGFFGPAGADAIGYPQFMLATAVTKGLEGLLVGVIGGRRNVDSWRKVTAAIVGGGTIVVGYFLFEAMIYPWMGTTIPFFAVTDISMAVSEIIPNIAQATISVVIGLALWRAVSGVELRRDSDEKSS